MLKDILKSPNRQLALCFVVILGFGLWGIRWGLPSSARAAMVLDPSLRTPEFYSRIEKARDEMYEQIGGDIAAYYGRSQNKKNENAYLTMLNSYSSFLVKTHAMDEAATLVMISRINPLRNRWYPQSFLYGGAYLYPLCGVLLAGHISHAIQLIPSSSYYYAHPDAIARIYTLIRGVSVVGLLVAAVAVFDLAGLLFSRAAAPWAMLFFGLAPTLMAHSKLAKPHTWAAALSLWAIDLSIRARKSPKPAKLLLGASLLSGWALGMTVTQVFFVPFVLWAAWAGEARGRLKRLILTMAVIGGMYLATNFYLFSHWDDYQAEQVFLKAHAPFAFNLRAAWEFFSKVLLISLGGELWSLVMVGWLWTSLQKKHEIARHIAWYLWALTIYIAFQTQIESGTPIISRLVMAMIGLFGVMASALTFEWKSFGRVLRWGCLSAMVIKACVYDLHFQSDRVGRDNATLAAHWINANIPAQSVIAQSQAIPHLDFFPPIDFTKYNIARIRNLDLTKERRIIYAVAGGREPDTKNVLVAKGFHLLKRFAESPLQKLGFEDPFTNANFIIDIYIWGNP